MTYFYLSLTCVYFGYCCCFPIAVLVMAMMMSRPANSEWNEILMTRKTVIQK